MMLTTTTTQHTTFLIVSIFHFMYVITVLWGLTDHRWRLLTNVHKLLVTLVIVFVQLNSDTNDHNGICVCSARICVWMCYVCNYVWRWLLEFLHEIRNRCSVFSGAGVSETIKLIHTYTCTATHFISWKCFSSMCSVSDMFAPIQIYPTNDTKAVCWCESRKLPNKQFFSRNFMRLAKFGNSYVRFSCERAETSNTYAVHSRIRTHMTHTPSNSMRTRKCLPRNCRVFFLRRLSAALIDYCYRYFRAKFRRTQQNHMNHPHIPGAEEDTSHNFFCFAGADINWNKCVFVFGYL